MYFACMVVIAIGLIAYASMSIVLENLQRAQNVFYTETHFADGFIQLTGYPENKVSGLSHISGIDVIEGRIVKDVRIFEEKTDSNRSLRLVSLNTSDPKLDLVHLSSGRIPEDNSAEMLVDPKFFAAGKFHLGDPLTLILEGKRATFTIVGTAQNPEFIYAMRNAQDIYPDPSSFGIAYVPTASLKSLVKESGQVNDLIFSLKPGTDFTAVKNQLQTELAPYGVQSIIPREDQTSHFILNNELTQLKGTTKTLPVIFLGVAAIILYTMLRRLIEQQRVAIGTLKAFGHTNREIIFHYLSYPLLIGFIGGLMGGLTGIALSFPLTSLYEEFFALPGLQSSFSLKYLFWGIVLSLFFSLISGIRACLDILRLEPASAMRPPVPTAARKTPLEKVSLIWNSFSAQTQMGVRNTFRSPVRSMITVLALAVVYSMMAVSWSIQSMSDKLTTFQYEQVQTYDVKISMQAPSAMRAVRNTLAREPGVTEVDPVLEAPATIKNQWLEKEVVIMGLPRETTLYNILDQNENRVEVPESGILLSEHLADLLQVKTGDSVIVESSLNRELIADTPRTIAVQGIVPQYIGLNAFMDIDSLQDFLRQGEISTSMLIKIDPEQLSALKSKYRDAGQVATLESIQENAEKIKQMMESYNFTTYFLAVIAGIAGFALIYNSSIISLSERKRELASLSVLGLTPREILQVIISEQWTLSLSGILLGIPLAYALLAGMAKSLSTDLYSIPADLPPSALLWAAAGTVIFVWIAQNQTFRRIKSLPFVEILAVQE